MWLFLVADGAGFVSLLAAYAVLRLRAEAWPARGSRLSLPFAVGLTVVLAVSSATMLLARRAALSGRARATLAWLGATMLGGVLFLAGQAREWHTLGRDGRMHPGADQMASTFFAVTGFHGAHVFCGVVLLAIFASRAARGRTTGVDTIALYWQFVDVAWLFIFGALYLA